MQHIIFCVVRILSIFYICKKLIEKEIYHRHSKIHFISYTMSIFAVSLLLQKYLLPYTTLVFIILIFIYLSNLYKLKNSLALTLSLISYAIYYLVYTICSLLPALIGGIYYYHYGIFPYTLIVFITGVLTILFVHILLNTKRINYGFSLFSNRKFANIFTVISISILLIKTCYFNYNNDKIFKFGISKTLPFPILLLLLALLLFTWWRKQITKSYIEKLRKLELQSLYDELEEKEQQIKKLTADNQSLSRIIHKDNKLIPAMEHAVTNFLSCYDFNDIDKLTQYGRELTLKLQDMTKDRQGILDSYENANHKLRLTGRVSIDAILVYMNKKAETNHITFECKHSSENMDYLLSKISENDLTHLLSDLLENALIAMKNQERGRLQVTFGKFQKEAYIAVADSGMHFDITTLHSFGLQPHTTHEDSGGSGIGLMDIWKIKRKYRATIQIQEYKRNDDNFTKKILFSFNSKNHYVIQSFRHTEISNTQTRGDLYVIPMDTKEMNEGK